jgi:peptidyl-prolyl cis-trans isomerase SurA
MNAIEAIFRVVLDVSWRSSCLVLVVFALRSMLRGRLPARVVFWVWIAVAVRLLLPFGLPVAWSPFNFAPFAHRPDLVIMRGPEAGESQQFVAQPSLPALSKAAAVSGDRLSWRKKLTFGQWAALVWCGGVVALLLARIWAYGCFVRALRRSRTAPSPAVAALLADAANRSGVGRINACVTDVVSAPALHGIFRPQLLFPPDFVEKLTPSELQHIVAHELAHDQRRDLLAQLLIRAAVVLHWFNPLVWMVARIARNDCELACDESILRRLTAHERESYGATLLKIVSLANCGTPPPLGLGVIESKQQIKRRIQMIVAQPSSTFARAILGCALFSLVVGLSLTCETIAQPTSAVTGVGVPPAVRTIAAPESSPPKFAYDPSTDALSTLSPNGIVATVGDKVITVEDVRREMKPLIPFLQREARSQDDFNQRLNKLQNDAIQAIVSHVLLVKEFHNHKAGEEGKHIAANDVDNAIADRLREQFDNDQSKFLAYLQTRGLTMSDFRREVEEDIVYSYMRTQEKKWDPNVNAQRAKSGGQENQVHLRLIQLNRTAGATDAALLDKANVILGRLKNGETFEVLAREFSEDQRRDRGGDWGWQGPTDMKPDFSEKLFALKKGEVSAPIVTKEGCFLLYAEDRR